MLVGPEGLAVGGRPEVDIVVSAIVGQRRLAGHWAARGGKTVALANKETLVVAGPLVMQLAARRKAPNCCRSTANTAPSFRRCRPAGARGRRIILTASGGPFRHHTPRTAGRRDGGRGLAHPTWDMGPKITVDSATMMNKALEIIEARWLFDLPPDQIDVVVHPQSIVHSHGGIQGRFGGRPD